MTARHRDGVPLPCDAVADGVVNPRCVISNERDTEAWIVALDGANQPEIRIDHQFGELDSPAMMLLGEGESKSQVRLQQRALGRVPLALRLRRVPKHARQSPLLIHAQHRTMGEIVDISSEEI